MKFTPSIKRIIIREKRQQDEVPVTSPYEVSSKGKEGMPIPKPKKAKSMPSKAAIIVVRLVAPGEGTSANLMEVLGPKVTMLKKSYHSWKILEACIPPFDKEKVDKLELDRMVSKLFHILGQVVC